VNKSTGVIEINGNRYDAVTGQVIGAVQKITQQVTTPLSGGSIDGFARRRPVVGTAQAIHKRAQNSRTLMRAAVKQPAKVEKPNAPRSQSAARDGSMNPLRFSRAGAVAKSHRVSRFGHVSASGNDKKTSASRPAVGEVITKASGSELNSKSTAVTRPLPSLVASASHQHLERLLDLALVRADAHKQRLSDSGRKTGLWQRLRSRKWMSIGAVLLALALLGGYFAMQKVPQVAIKVAAMRAHIDASMPDYIPSGFNYAGPVEYSNKQVTLKFKDGKDGRRTFELTQKASNLNSTSLAAATLPKNSQIQTSQVRGTTVYIYGPKNDATWVNHGINYTIEGTADLDSDQLLRIAGSL
jgi:hypothetical protein